MKKACQRINKLEYYKIEYENHKIKIKYLKEKRLVDNENDQDQVH